MAACGGATAGRRRSSSVSASRRRATSSARTIACCRRRAYVARGVDARGHQDDELIGGFGLSGHGAAGFELDRTDKRLGTPPHAIVLARSEGHEPEAPWVLVPEEQLTHLTTVAGRASRRADPRRPDVLRDARRRRRVLDRLDHVLRIAAAQRLRQQRLAAASATCSIASSIPMRSSKCRSDEVGHAG